MTKKHFTNIFNLTFFFLVLTEIVSFFGQLFHPINTAGFIIIVLIALGLSLYDLKYGLFVVLAELFIGGKGYLFSYDFNGSSVSIRIALFLVIFSVWIGNKLKNKDLKINLNQNFLWSYILLGLIIMLGLANGFARNELSNVLFDFNAWLFFILIPIFIDIIKTEKIVKEIIKILFASTTLLAAKTLLVLILFSHNLNTIGDSFYKWLRDSGVGEITYISGTLFRVFFQSHLYVMVGLFIAIILLLTSKKINDWRKNTPLLAYIYLMSLTLIISQSRSYWLGATVGLGTILLLILFKLENKIKKTFLIVSIATLFIFTQVLLIQVITNNFSNNPVSDRFKNLATDAAGNSRLNQLNPLISNIATQPFFGYGFGKELTYQSTDPRIIQTHPGGEYTTYAFEWGYLDITLKLGGLGLIIYLFLIFTIFKTGLKKQSPLNYGLLAGLVAILVTNIFSPYLNHPLGIGYLLLISSIFNQELG